MENNVQAVYLIFMVLIMFLSFLHHPSSLTLGVWRSHLGRQTHNLKILALALPLCFPHVT